MSKQIRIPVDGGHLAAIDHGGPGRPMLLVHGSGHNAAAWNALAAHLAPRYRIVALDLRGHGQSTAESTTAEQYWRDLAAAVARSSRTSPSTTPNAAYLGVSERRRV
jgi:pimeloyl-ACP methyl ester carboxylesterase